MGDNPKLAYIPHSCSKPYLATKKAEKSENSQLTSDNRLKYRNLKIAPVEQQKGKHHMTHAGRKLKITVSGTTNWKNNTKTYATKTYDYSYERDDDIRPHIADAEKFYKQWLKSEVSDEREMLHLELKTSHRVTYGN